MNKTNELIIETQNLDFGFNSERKILNNINLKVEKGSIYGFLGPNGAGKTTTMRLLLGLLKSPGNCIQLFEEEINTAPSSIFKKVGAFIESPSLYEHLTGYDNLEISRILGEVGKERIAEVLEIVNLSNESNIKVSNYSLGMKQRLAIALALLSKPELLILDEPTNGLDPNGINETRELILQLNRDYGTTIFISSHILSEIEKMVTHLGIIHKGSMIFQGKIEDLLKMHQTRSSLLIQTNDNIKAMSILHELYHSDLNAKGLEVKVENEVDSDIINKALINNGINVLQLQLMNADLEKIYLDLTKS
jgi:ABC-type multidrug transport system ATPase subunit